MRVKSVYKAKKGLIRVDKEVTNGIITEVRITGDFFMYPEDSLPLLENRLRGVKNDKESIRDAVKSFFKDTGTVTPFVTEEDLVEALAGGEIQ